MIFFFFSFRAVTDWEVTRFMDQINCDDAKWQQKKTGNH